jgi:hypothetical protein
MSPEASLSRCTKTWLKRGRTARPDEQHGVPDRSRIVKLFAGQGHGFIRVANDREIYFHRADLQEGMSINDCEIGDVVTFERIDDVVSGPRARCVQRQQRGR